MRHAALFLLLSACGGTTGVIAVGDTDSVGNPDEHDTGTIPDYSEYDNATLRIVTPTSGAFLALEESHEFVAELLGEDGAPLDFDGITWSSSVDDAWDHSGRTFEDQTLSVGLHDITAQVSLPNGDRLAYTAGGVLVQSWYAGTYAGLFSADVTFDYQGTPVTVTCSGDALLVVEPMGEHATGDSTCLLSLMGFDLPADFVYDLDNDDGDLTGTANVDLGFFQVPFDATGTLDRDAHTLDIAFAGSLATFGDMSATVGTTRVSLDAGAP
jgi:hypothetical protein